MVKSEVSDYCKAAKYVNFGNNVSNFQENI